MKRIELNIDNNKVVCVKKCCKNVKGHTLVILPGATTENVDYYLLMCYLKGIEVIIINNLAHGRGKYESIGTALTKANDLINFHVKVIKKLIDLGYCSTSKIDVLAYSLGGMSLINIINRQSLKGVLDTAIILCSDCKTANDLIEVEGLYNKETKTFNSKKLLNLTITKESPWYLKFSPMKLLSCNSISSIADIYLCKSFNELAEQEPLRNNIDTKIIDITSKDDYFFDENNAENLGKHFDDFTLIRTKRCHLLPIEAPKMTANLILNAIK
ncbi:MAG TPA: hypothetical protein VIK86_06600 [Candidatus Paceibacterota bacterium]